MCKSITDKKFFFQFIQHTNTQHTHTHAHVIVLTLNFILCEWNDFYVCLSIAMKHKYGPRRVVPRTLSDEISCLKGVNED